MAATRVPVNAASIREILVRHDPLAAWASAAPNSDGYQLAAELAADSLGNMLGLGQAWTVVADALDLQHPGLYRALRAGDPALQQRIGLVAREIWDRHGMIRPRPPRVTRPTQAPPPPPPPAPILLREPDLLEGWLRGMEVALDAETGLPVAERRSAAVLLSMLPGFLDAYAEASSRERAEARLAFSRFGLCCHRLSGFAGLQNAALDGPEPGVALRRGLLAESLLDLQLDWRDELLVVQAFKTRAAALGLPYGELVGLAAALSSEGTGRFLLDA